MNDLENQIERINLRIDKFLGDEKTKQILINTIENRDTIRKMGFPVYILSGKCGSGCTTFSKILADIIDVYRILPKVSTNNFIEMEYPYSEVQEEYNKFFDAFRWAAETTNEFYGVALIDMFGYETNYENERFLDLLDFIKENKKNTVFILRLHTFDKSRVDEIQAIIEKYSYTEQIELPHLETEEYLKYIISKCNSSNISFVPNEEIVLKILKAYIDEAKKAKYFSGLHTINTFISHFTYSQMGNKNSNGKIEITEENLKALADEFFSKMTSNYRKIGF